MEDDIKVRRLVEILAEFFTLKVDVKEDLTCSLTSEFLRNMQDVVFTKMLSAFQRWKLFYDSFQGTMVSSPAIYLQYLIHPCHDADVSCNIFERFLITFAIITRINIQTCNIKGIDFCPLTVDIFMVLYEKHYRKRFLKIGGFRRFVEYVNNPNYLDSNCVMRNISETYKTYTVDTIIPQDIVEKLNLISIKRYKIPPQKVSSQEIETNRYVSNLVQKILSIAKPEHIPLCSKEAPKKDSTQQTPTKIEKGSDSIVETAEKENFDSETARQILDITQYENIIDAVIRHNHSKSSGQVKSTSRIQKEAEGTLEHLKNTIKSLMEVLDNDRN